MALKRPDPNFGAKLVGINFLYSHPFDRLGEVWSDAAFFVEVGAVVKSRKLGGVGYDLLFGFMR